MICQRYFLFVHVLPRLIFVFLKYLIFAYGGKCHPWLPSFGIAWQRITKQAMDTIATTLVISRKKFVEITFVAASECLWKLLTAKPFDIHAT